MSPRSRIQWLVAALGLAVSAAFIYAALARLDREAVLGALRGAELWPWALLGAGAYCVGHLVRGVRCALLVAPEAKLGVGTASNIVVVGYAVNNLLPARMGELARSGMLAERTGLPVAQALTVTAAERLLDGVTIVLLFLACATVVPLPAWAVAGARLGSLIFGAGLVGMVFVVVAPRLVTRWAARVAQWLPRSLQSRVVRLAAQVTQGLASLRDPAAAARIGGLSLLVWLLEACLFLALLPAVGLPADPLIALFVMAATNLGILVPSSPGFIGPFHWFAMQSLMLLAPVPEATALTYAVLVHALFFIPVTLWGVGALALYGVQLGQTLAVARMAKSGGEIEVGGVQMQLLTRGGPEADLDREPPAWMVSVVGALAAGDGLELAPEVRREVVLRSARTVAGQMRSLPPLVGILFALGVIFFRVTTALFTFRPFHRHSPERQQRIAEWWAYGPFPPGRQLFRALRSTTLLAFWSSPEVAAALAAREGEA